MPKIYWFPIRPLGYRKHFPLPFYLLSGALLIGKPRFKLQTHSASEKKMTRNGEKEGRECLYSVQYTCMCIYLRIRSVVMSQSYKINWLCVNGQLQHKSRFRCKSFGLLSLSFYSYCLRRIRLKMKSVSLVEQRGTLFIVYISLIILIHWCVNMDIQK